MRRYLAFCLPLAAMLACPVAARADDAPPAPPAPAAQPLAGAYGGVFFLRDEADDFRLYFQGRAQVDSYNYFGAGVPETSLKSSVFLRRIRPEISGELLHRFQFMLAGDWGQNGVDNAGGTNEAYASKAGTAPSATSGQYSSAQTASVKAAPTDVWINYRASGLFNLQFGQFDAPFTMENRTSDKYLPFMERSLAVRALGVPTNKEVGAMVWGETADKLVFWSVGAFDGDGQNRPNVDNRADVMGRVFAHPLAHVGGPLKDVQIGGSFRYGMRDATYVNYDYAAMTTQGNYAFWKPTYTSSTGTTHVLPSGAQVGFAGELRVPVGDFDLTAEYVQVNNHTRETADGDPTKTWRRGALTGNAWYATVGWWPFGNRDVNGLPGYENPTHLDFSKKPAKSPPRALQVLVKYEQLRVKYDSASRDGSTPDAKNIDGDTKLDALTVGVNYWATKHVRFTLDWVMNRFPDSSDAPTSAQRAQAPGNAAKTADADTRATAHVLHEVLGRVAIAF